MNKRHKVPSCRRNMAGFPHELPMPNNQDHIRNSEVAARTGLAPVSDLITHCRNYVFGHIARFYEDTPAHQALQCHVDLTLGHLPDQSWKRCPGRPNNRWIDQLCRVNNNTPRADLWRRSTTRGHMGVTLRSSTTMRWRRWRRHNVTFMRHEFLLLIVKQWLKSVYIYGSCSKIKTEVSLVWTFLYSDNSDSTIKTGKGYLEEKGRENRKE